MFPPPLRSGGNAALSGSAALGFKMTRRLIFVGLLLAAFVAHGGEASFDKQFWTLFGFPLNDVSLGDVQECLGSTQIFEVPEGHHERAICYRSTHDSTVVVFSIGELGGGKQLLGVALEGDSLHKYSCSKPAVDLPAAFPMTSNEPLPRLRVTNAMETKRSLDSFRNVVGWMCRNRSG
jgi:hypothetical protein